MRENYVIFKVVPILMGIGFVFIISMMALRGAMIYRSLSGGEKVYEITVNNYQTPESYLTSKYEKDAKSGCITFKDEFGFKQIVCNNYTITEY